MNFSKLGVKRLEDAVILAFDAMQMLLSKSLFFLFIFSFKGVINGNFKALEFIFLRFN